MFLVATLGLGFWGQATEIQWTSAANTASETDVRTDGQLLYAYAPPDWLRMTLSVGQQIGIYRIVRLLGQGGMGAVYEVEHTQLGVHYALKAFTFEGGHDRLLKNKFLAEGKVLARLRNPHLVRVFDLNFDEATGTSYFVMDLVLSENGNPCTLADVQTTELDEDRILQWFVELAAALDYIHAQGIVHRDVKLGNVLLSADGHVVLSDFGVSHLFSERLRTDVSAVKTMVSEIVTGCPVVMGTQGYMAPEVVRGEEVTPAADAYSLGVMFVHLLTGIWYEPGSKVFRLLETLEYRWADVLSRLLAESPAERPSNLAELGALVRQDAAPAAVSSRPPCPPQWRRWIVLLIIGAVVAVLSAVAAFSRFGRADPSETDAFGVFGIYEEPRK